jgi:hypothetical protein
MLFDNIFSFASQGATSGEDIGQRLSNEIPGNSSTAKIVREESPEALAVLGFIGALSRVTLQAASTQNADANDPGTTSQAASSVMEKSHETLQRDADLKKSSGSGM